MYNEENEKLKNLFKEAASITNNRNNNLEIDNKEIPIEAEVYEYKEYPVFVPNENRTLEEKVLDFTESGLTKWDLIAARMDGDFSERFMKEVETLSGREFVRTYLKMLEYFKPKVIRVENKTQEEEDTVISVKVYNSYEEVKEESNGD